MINSLILSLPILLELLNPNSFRVEVPISPYSLGELAFIFYGFINFRLEYLKSRAVKSILCIYTLIIVSSIYSGRIDDISRSLSTIIFVISSFGYIHIFQRRSVIQIFSFWFIVTWVYWFYYLINKTVVGGGGDILSYNEMFAASEVLNHHTLGMFLCLSGAFITSRSFLLSKSLNIFGSAVCIITLVALFLTESRSNFLIYLIFVGIIFLRFTKVNLRTISAVIFVFVCTQALTNSISNKNERLKQRFSFDMEYQTITNVSRALIYQSIGNEVFQNPFGKGSIGGSKLNIEGSPISPHNQFFGYLLKGGWIAIIPVCLLISCLVDISKFGYKNFLIHSHEIISILVVCILYWTSILFIDVGGLLYHLMCGTTFYLYTIIESYKKIYR